MGFGNSSICQYHGRLVGGCACSITRMSGQVVPIVHPRQPIRSTLAQAAVYLLLPSAEVYDTQGLSRCITWRDY